jgi:hypothetical protein
MAMLMKLTPTAQNVIVWYLSKLAITASICSCVQDISVESPTRASATFLARSLPSVRASTVRRARARVCTSATPESRPQIGDFHTNV